MICVEQIESAKPTGEGTGMTYIVVIGSGPRRALVHFPTPEKALEKARHEVSRDALDVSIIVSATSRVYTPNGFEAAVVRLQSSITSERVAVIWGQASDPTIARLPSNSCT